MIVLSTALLSTALAPPAFAQQTDDPPLTGDAYVAADAAYAAFARRDYAQAAASAAQAVSQRPDLLRLHLLQIDSLIAAGDMTGASEAATAALRRFPQSQEIAARQARVRETQAASPADAGYKAFAAGNYKGAVREASRAIEYNPDSIPYRLLKLLAQIEDGDLPGALATADGAIKVDPENYVPRVWRGYIDSRLGRTEDARRDFETALKIPGLTDDELKNIRLIATDAALAANDPQRAAALLGSYDRADPQVVVRLGDAEGASKGRGTLKGDGKAMPRPVQQCEATPYGSVCALVAPGVQSVLQVRDRASEALDAANRAYSAQRSRDYGLAIREARKAVEAAPDVPANRELLINLLSLSGQTAAAETEATRLINEGRASGSVYAQRGYARSRQKNLTGAMSDWDMALRKGLAADQIRGVRLALADAALTLHQPERAIAALSGLKTGHDVAIRRAYALLALGRKDEALAAFTQAQQFSRDATERDTALQARVTLLIDLGRKPEARALFDEAEAAGAFRTIREADRAYLAVAVGNDAVAMRDFDDAAARGTLPPRADFDAGYTAMRQFENRKAIAYLKEGIDAAAAGRFDVDPQRLFEIRRTVADLSREWGLNASVIYSKAGAGPNPFLVTPPNSNYTGQLGTELYYRPEGIGNRNGALFDVFVRVFETLYDQGGGITGAPTLQGVVGARWKPLSDQNLVFEIDRLFAIGNAAQNDVLLRAAYSYQVGTDLRVVDPSWLTWMVYGEVDKFLESGQLVVQGEGRFGRSYRLDWVSPNLVVFPHVMAAASYNTAFAEPQAYAAGLGASLRYWFGETKYMAPPSYLELTMQYRFRLGGDSRAQGIFAQAAVNY